MPLFQISEFAKKYDAVRNDRLGHALEDFHMMLGLWDSYLPATYLTHCTFYTFIKIRDSLSHGFRALRKTLSSSDLILIVTSGIFILEAFTKNDYPGSHDREVYCKYNDQTDKNPGTSIWSQIDLNDYWENFKVPWNSSFKFFPEIYATYWNYWFF